MGDPNLKTPLHDWHASHGGRMVEFGGWRMPVQYRSIVEEHHAVRRKVGLFDIAHMGRLEFEGPDALGLLEHATTNHVALLVEGQIQYSLMTGEDGGILDDVLVYRLRDGYAMVCNASNRGKVVSQLERLAEGRSVRVQDRTLETFMLAVQGPLAIDVVEAATGATLRDLAYYYSKLVRWHDRDMLASRTGYTGEDGLELVVPVEQATDLWSSVLAAGEAAGILPCGLGARDTLRLEAAMPLYGHEMDESVDPYAAGLGWAVKLEKGPFEGREALRGLKKSNRRRRIGLELGGKRIARQGAVISGADGPVGVVTSGTFSPTLERSIAMALVDRSFSTPGTNLSVDVRGQVEPAQVVTLPFYRRPAAAAGPSVG